MQVVNRAIGEEGNMLITAYPEIVRREGLAVEVVGGFSSRSHGEFRRNPPAIVWHHDASPPGPSPGVLNWMISNWDTASANIWVDFYGKWWFVGAGVAWHAGAVLPGMPGNFDAIGIETDYTVGETISPKLYDSLRRGTAAIMRANKQPTSDLHFHKTICSPVGRKSDPWALDLNIERTAVGKLISGNVPPLPKPVPTPIPNPIPPGGSDPNEDEMALSVVRCDGIDYAFSAAGGVFYKVRDPDHYQWLINTGIITTPHGTAPNKAPDEIEFIRAECARAADRHPEYARVEGYSPKA